jgi:D-glycero-D-manno-heptose 1,7-bisphosphate phosphatase
MVAAIFLDRDGTINRPVVRSDGTAGAPWLAEDFDVYSDVREAFARINDSRYKVFVVTNQPDLDDVKLTFRELDKMNAELRTLYPIEAISVATNRESHLYKPNPGMIDALVKEYDIDVGESWMIGDRWKDVYAGRAAGLKTILINLAEMRGIPETFEVFKADYITWTLCDAIDITNGWRL